MSEQQKTKRYLIVNKKGNFAQRQKEARDGFTKVDWALEERNGTYYEKEFREALVGKIAGIIKKNSDYGERLMIRFEEKDFVSFIQLDYLKSFAQTFLNLLPQINLNKEVEMRPYDFQPSDSDKRKRGISIKQNDVKLQSFYFDNKNGIPPFPEGETKGSKKIKRWILDLEEFFDNEIENRHKNLVVAFNELDEQDKANSNSNHTAVEKPSTKDAPKPKSQKSNSNPTTPSESNHQFERVDPKDAFGVDNDEDDSDLPF